MRRHVVLTTFVLGAAIGSACAVRNGDGQKMLPAGGGNPPAILNVRLIPDGPGCKYELEPGPGVVDPPRRDPDDWIGWMIHNGCTPRYRVRIRVLKNTPPDGSADPLDNPWPSARAGVTVVVDSRGTEPAWVRIKRQKETNVKSGPNVYTYEIYLEATGSPGQDLVIDPEVIIDW